MSDGRLNHLRFRAIREGTGLTQKQLAAKAGVSESFVKLIERGKTQPSRPFRLVLARALRCKLEDFTDPAESDAA